MYDCIHMVGRNKIYGHIRKKAGNGIILLCSYYAK